MIARSPRKLRRRHRHHHLHQHQRQHHTYTSLCWSCCCRFLLLVGFVGLVGAAPDFTPPFSTRAGFVLNDFVKYWEAADYEHNILRAAHRARRGIETPSLEPLKLNFKAHDREFRLKLHPDPGSVFADDAEFHNSHGPLEFHLGNVYTGTLDDDEDSFVHGVITSNGLFDGTIYTRQDVFYIEPINRYGKTHSKIHSVIYKISDVIHPNANSTQPCASHLLHVKERSKAAKKHQSYKKSHNSINQGTIVKYISKFDSDVDSLQKLDRAKRWLPSNDDNIKVFKYTDLQGDDVAENDDEGDVNDDDDEDDNVAPLRNPSLPIDLYVPYYSESEDSNLEVIINKIKNNTDKTRGILISSYDDDNYGDSFSRPNSKNHVEIKSKVNIQNDIISKKPVGYTIVSSLMGNVSDSALRHVNKRATIDPKKTTCMLYLQADHLFFQKFGTEEACIEVMTRHVQRVNSIYRVTDFNQDGKSDNITFMIKRIKVHTTDALKDPLYRFPNNYGVEKFLELFSEEDYDGFCLAYMFTYRDFEMGTLGLAWTGDLKNAGGVCEKNGHYRGSLKSLNTGIVTLLNYGKHVPPAVSHVTLAHEIGHNFGSPHDPEVCTPGGEDGNFIMFARATSGDKRNNNQFSPCSLKSINPVLNNKARSSKGCFTEPQASLCGNGVVEEGEECDCGWEGDCREPCCYPQRRHPPPGETPCRLTPRSVCSPSQGPCCTSQCSLRFGDECRSDNGCRDASYCDGRRPHCPPSVSKPNRTVCDDGFVCYMGECTGSICLAYGLESCQCSADRACDLCCRLPGPGNPCRSSFHWNSPPYDVPDMFAKPGTPCNDYNGYCDVFQKCREVDPSGPLATLRKLLLSEESLTSFKRWIWEHWYAVALIILAVIFLLVGSTRLLGKRSDGKLKSVTIIHSSTTETVRLPDLCQDGVIVHTAVRSKLPLKKKVALKARSQRKKKDKSRDTDQSPRLNNNGKNKKRAVAPAAADEHKQTKEVTSNQIEAVALKLRKTSAGKHKTIIAKRKGKKNKEVIDYSAAQKDSDKNIPGAVPIIAEADSVGKVQNWLLNTPRPAVITKSKSTPIGLTDKAFTSNSKGVSSSKVTRVKHSKSASKSCNNLNQGEKDKMRLQVVYKPPFKFSLKLCKADKMRVVLDKTPHNRHELAKNKSHRTPPKSEDVDRLNKTVSNFNVPVTDIINCQNSQITQISNTATVGLSNVPESPHYEKINNSLTRAPNEERVSQHRKVGSKWSHKKSSSVGQGNQITDSRQNLIQDNSLDSNFHFYENVFATVSGVDNNENRSKKTSSMPRNISTRNPSNISKHGVAPSLRMSSQRAIQRNNGSIANRHVKKSVSNASQQHGVNLQKVNSLNNLNLDAERKRNSLSHKKRNSMAAEHVYSNIEPKKTLKLSGVDGASGSKGHLKRQMSATELYKGPPRGDFFMPMSAGANYHEEFEWNGSKKLNCTDNQVPLNLPDSQTGRDCLESQIVPNISDNQTPLELNLENRKKKSSVSKNVPISSTSFQKRPHVIQDDSSVCSFPDSYQGGCSQWPQKFSDLKNTLPDSSQIVDPAAYMSDMEVLVSDNDFSIYNV